MAAGFKSGGRQKGTPNRSTLVRQSQMVEALTKLGFAEQCGLRAFSLIHHAQVLLEDPEVAPLVKVELIKALMPYAFPKLGPLPQVSASERRIIVEID